MFADAVPTSAPQSDRDLERRVVLYLASRRVAGLEQLEIHADRRVVTLRGCVDSVRANRIAVASAQRVAGVLRVIDDISVLASRVETEDTPAPVSLSQTIVRYLDQQRNRRVGRRVAS